MERSSAWTSAFWKFCLDHRICPSPSQCGAVRSECRPHAGCRAVRGRARLRGPPTADLHSQQPTVLWLGGQQAPDRCVLSVCVRLPGLLHPRGRNKNKPFRHSAAGVAYRRKLHAAEQRGHLRSSLRSSLATSTTLVATFLAHASGRTLCGETPSSQNTHSRARSSMADKCRENGRNDTDSRREGEGGDGGATRSP